MENPHCDTATGKIYNAKEGSWYYWHEKGHLQFSDEKSGLLMIQSFIFLFWMLCVTAGNRLLSWIGFAGYMGIYIYEEWWANKFAWENKPTNLKS